MNEIPSFAFNLHTDLRFGAGRAQELPGWLEASGWRRVALVVDSGAAANPYWRAVETILLQKFEVVRLESDMAEPSYDYLDQARKQFADKDLDVFVAVGGGSTLDLGKALSLLVTNLKPAIEYRGFDQPKNAGVPLVAVPTTAGSGSEVTPNAVFTDTSEQRKFGINTALYLPRFCVLDPNLTASCPPQVATSSGMDALVHTHESYVSRQATPITKIFSIAAFELLFNHLAAAVEEKFNVAARGHVLLGSYLAGTALFNSSSGPCGGLSYPLGVQYKVPHGLAGAVFLPHIMAHNVARGYTGYKALYDRVAGAPSIADPVAAGEALTERMFALCRRLNVPSRLEAFQFQRANLDGFMVHVRKLQAAFDFNPIPFGADDARRILEEMTAPLAAKD